MKKIPPFYVGQKVVAVRNARYGVWTKGDEFTVRDITQTSCGCWAVDIGLSQPFEATHYQCEKCKMRSVLRADGKTGWARASSFAPIHSDFQAITFEKVLETELASVN